jgi:hypothetical protein
MFYARFAELVESGEISQTDADTFSRWIDMSGTPCFHVYIQARCGYLDHLKDDAGFQATMRVLDTMGLSAIDFSDKGAMPTEELFWEQFDGVYQLTEAEMKRELPNFVTDPNNRAKVDALLAGRTETIKESESTRQLA